MSASSPSSSATTTTSPRSSTTPSPALASWPAATPSAPPSSFSRDGWHRSASMPASRSSNSISGLMGFVSFFDNFIQIIILLIAWLIVVISFFIMAIQLFVSLIEFKLTTLAGFVLVPFGLFNRTAFLAEKVLGNVFSSGVKVLVLAVIVGIGSTIFGQFTSGFNNPPDHRRCADADLGRLGVARSLDLRCRHRQRLDCRWSTARHRRGCRHRYGGRRRRCRRRGFGDWNGGRSRPCCGRRGGRRRYRRWWLDRWLPCRGCPWCRDGSGYGSHKSIAPRRGGPAWKSSKVEQGQRLAVARPVQNERAAATGRALLRGPRA